jgi:PAS domain S-box-containing protein
MAIEANKRDARQAGPQQNGRWLHALLQHSYDAIVLTSADGTTLFASPSIGRVLGYTPEEYQGQRGAELTHPDHLEEGVTFFRRLRDQPGVTLPPQRTRFRHKDGSWRWIEYTATNLLQEPEVGALVFNFRDITPQQQAEQALAERAHQQALVAGLGQQALAGIDVQRLMESVAQVLAETLGVELTSVIELSPDEKTLRMRAGVGWGEDLDKITMASGKRSQAGYTLATRQPVVVEDYRHEQRFAKHAWLVKHQVVSSLSVVIAGQSRPVGVLALHTTRPRALPAMTSRLCRPWPPSWRSRSSGHAPTRRATHNRVWSMA